MHPPYPRTAFITAINGGVFCRIFINVRDIFDCVAKKKDGGFIFEVLSVKHKIRLHFGGLWWVKYLATSLWRVIHDAEKEIEDARSGMGE